MILYCIRYEIIDRLIIFTKQFKEKGLRYSIVCDWFIQREGEMLINHHWINIKTHTDVCHANKYKKWVIIGLYFNFKIKQNQNKKRQVKELRPTVQTVYDDDEKYLDYYWYIALGRFILITSIKLAFPSRTIGTFVWYFALFSIFAERTRILCLPLFFHTVCYHQ